MDATDFDKVLLETTLYNDDASKQVILNDKSKVADALALNFFAALGIINASDFQKKPYHYKRLVKLMKADKNFRVSSITDENNDMSISVKLASDAGLFRTSKTVNEITRFLARNKANPVDRIDNATLRRWASDLKPEFRMLISDPLVRQKWIQWIDDKNNTLDISWFTSEVRKKAMRMDMAGQFGVLIKTYTDIAPAPSGVSVAGLTVGQGDGTIGPDSDDGVKAQPIVDSPTKVKTPTSKKTIVEDPLEWIGANCSMDDVYGYYASKQDVMFTDYLIRTKGTDVTFKNVRLSTSAMNNRLKQIKDTFFDKAEPMPNHIARLSSVKRKQAIDNTIDERNLGPMSKWFQTRPGLTLDSVEWGGGLNSVINLALLLSHAGFRDFVPAHALSFPGSTFSSKLLSLTALYDMNAITADLFTNSLAAIFVEGGMKSSSPHVLEVFAILNIANGNKEPSEVKSFDALCSPLESKINIDKYDLAILLMSHTSANVSIFKLTNILDVMPEDMKPTLQKWIDERSHLFGLAQDYVRLKRGEKTIHPDYLVKPWVMSRLPGWATLANSASPTDIAWHIIKAIIQRKNKYSAEDTAVGVLFDNITTPEEFITQNPAAYQDLKNRTTNVVKTWNKYANIHDMGISNDSDFNSSDDWFAVNKKVVDVFRYVKDVFQDMKGTTLDIYQQDQMQSLHDALKTNVCGISSSLLGLSYYYSTGAVSNLERNRIAYLAGYTKTYDASDMSGSDFYLWNSSAQNLNIRQILPLVNNLEFLKEKGLLDVFQSDKQLSRWVDAFKDSEVPASDPLYSYTRMGRGFPRTLAIWMCRNDVDLEKLFSGGAAISYYSRYLAEAVDRSLPFNILLSQIRPFAVSQSKLSQEVLGSDIQVGEKEQIVKNLLDGKNDSEKDALLYEVPNIKEVLGSIQFSSNTKDLLSNVTEKMMNYLPEKTRLVARVLRGDSISQDEIIDVINKTDTREGREIINEMATSQPLDVLKAMSNPKSDRVKCKKLVTNNYYVCQGLFKLDTQQSIELLKVDLAGNKFFITEQWDESLSRKAIDMEARNVRCTTLSEVISSAVSGDEFTDAEKEVILNGLTPGMFGWVVGSQSLHDMVYDDLKSSPIELMTNAKIDISQTLKLNGVDLKTLGREAKLRRRPREPQWDYYNRLLQHRDTTGTNNVSGLAPLQISTSDEDVLAISREILKSNYAGKHGYTFPVIRKTWAMDKVEDRAGFDKLLADGSKTVVPAFHGTNGVVANMVSRYGWAMIPVQGFNTNSRASKGGVNIAGRMLGDGIYFAPNIDKAGQYVSNSGFVAGGRGAMGYIFQMEAALGTLDRNTRRSHRGDEWKQWEPSYQAAGLGGDNIRSAEYVVRRPDQQLKIVKLHQVEVLPLDQAKQIINENVKMSSMRDLILEAMEVGQDIKPGYNWEFEVTSAMLPVPDGDSAFEIVPLEEALEKHIPEELVTQGAGRLYITFPNQDFYAFGRLPLTMLADETTIWNFVNALREYKKKARD